MGGTIAVRLFLFTQVRLHVAAGLRVPSVRCPLVTPAPAASAGSTGVSIARCPDSKCKSPVGGVEYFFDFAYYNLLDERRDFRCELGDVVLFCR